MTDRPSVERHTHENHYVPVPVDAFQAAHSWAAEHLVRKHPGTAETMTTLDSLIAQKLNAAS